MTEQATLARLSGSWAFALKLNHVPPVKHRRYPRAMTVCIAAKANWAMNEHIVLCSDWQVGDDSSMWEAPVKFEQHFGLSLTSLLAGSLEDASDLTRLYQERLGSRSMKLLELKEELHAGMNAFKKSLKRRGRDNSDVQLLIAGYVEGSATILYVDRNTVMEPAPYCAIGAGGPNAEAMLKWRLAHEPRDPFFDLSNVVYYVYEAKRFAEVSPHVGKRITEMIILQQSAEGHLKMDFLAPPTLDYLGEQYKQYGPQRLPEKRENLRNVPGMISDPSGHRGGNA